MKMQHTTDDDRLLRFKRFYKQHLNATHGKIENDLSRFPRWNNVKHATYSQR